MRREETDRDADDGRGADGRFGRRLAASIDGSRKQKGKPAGNSMAR